LYDTIKSHYVLLLQNNALDGVGNNLPKSSAFNEFANAHHKTTMKHIKKSFEPILPQDTLFNIDLSGKHLTMESAVAILRALRTRDDHNQITWPVSSLNLSGSKFCFPDKVVKSDNGTGRKNEEDKYFDRLEKLMFTELCEFLRDSKTLKHLNISDNPIGNEWMSKILIFGVRMSSSLREFHASNTNLDGGLTIPSILLEMLLQNTEIQKLVKVRKISGSVYRNMTLREVDLNGHPWNLESLDLFCALLYYCNRITQLHVIDDANKINQLRFNSKQFSFLMKRNASVSAIYDYIESSVFKRPFKTKLNTFRQSVKESKLKGKSVGDENGPAYKVKLLTLLMRSGLHKWINRKQILFTQLFSLL
jgi:hypothetical protein